MAIHSYQISGKFSPGVELIPSDLKLKHITKLGIQMEEEEQVALNGVLFEMGKSERIQFENAEIQSIKIIDPQYKKHFIIIDFLYDDGEED